MGQPHTVSRRALLKGALAGSAVSTLSFSQIFGFRNVFAQDGDDDVQTILNLAATAETFACTHYYTALTQSTIPLDAGEISIIKGFLDAELQHLEFLNGNGAQTLVTEFYTPENVFNDREQFSLVTEQAEFAFIGAYLAAVRRISELGNPLLATVAAQVAAVEQEHLALVRQIGGRRPNNQSIGRAPFRNVSNVVPVLQPFLEGAPNFDGPVPFPGADAIRDIIRDEGVLPIIPATSPQAFQGLSASDSALITTEGAVAATEEPGVDCSVTPAGNYNVNIRSAGTITASIVGSLSAGEVAFVDAQTTDLNGFIWRRITGRGWVRSDVTATTGTCSTLPTV